MAPEVTLHHLALTVTDVDSSLAWYQEVFGLSKMMEAPHEGGTGIVLGNEQGTMMLVLHRHDVNEGERFSERRTGLDHAGFRVSSRTDLQQWQDHLETHGVMRSDRADQPLTQSPIADTPYGYILVFRDPDNIQLEFFAPPEG
jgi:catechol 2,3-dioxygenase-like lactoylglutathione lyase family enzyme